MKILLLLSLFILNSCALFKNSDLSNNVISEIGKVCLDTNGRGRLIIQNNKYVFSFDSILNHEEDKWIMGLNFPLYGEELFEIEWEKEKLIHYSASFEQRILREKKGINPELLSLFLKKWADFINEVIQVQKNKNYEKNFIWKIQSNELVAETKLKGAGNAKITFLNLINSKYFGRFDIVLQNEKSKDSLKMEMIVRKCLKVTE